MTSAGLTDSPDSPDSSDVMACTCGADKRRLPTPTLAAIGLSFFAVTAVLWVVSVFILFSTVTSVAQPVATVLGGAAVFGAGLVTFKSARESRVSAAQTAADALSHAQAVAAAGRLQFEEQLVAQREQTERSLEEHARATALTLERELVRDLRSRYTTAAEQLAHSSAAIRLAGVYALAALADDWDQQGEFDEKQVAIDLLRAYLRTPIALQRFGSSSFDAGELEVRQSIMRVFAKRIHLAAEDRRSWRSSECALADSDLRGTSLPGIDLSGVDLTGVELSLADLTDANLSDAILSGAQLPGVRFGTATLVGASMGGANLLGAESVGADMSDTQLTFANLTDASLLGVNLTASDLFGATAMHANLTNAKLVGANLSSISLKGATLTGADLTDARISLIDHDESTRWPAGFAPTTG